MRLREETIRVQGMHCSSCERTIQAAVSAEPGVAGVKASHTAGTVTVRFDPERSDITAIKRAITGAGYDVKAGGFVQILGVLAVVGIVIWLGRNGGIDINSRLAGGATYMVLFVVGLLTSLHCAGMCGGIMLSQTLAAKPQNKLQSLKPALLYNAGRVVSYTVLGGVVGAIGSVFSISPIVKAGLMLFAGLFMTIAGTNMAGLSLARRLHLRLPTFGHRTGEKLGPKASSPFFVGLLNGLMPCGPLQTMQLFALGTGSAVKGAMTLLIFSLGTVPIMLTLGVLASIMSKGLTQRIARLSGVLVIALGLVMMSRGLTLAGVRIGLPSALAAKPSAQSGRVARAVIADGVQTITTVADNSGYTPNLLYVQRGIPVKWTVDGQKVNSCNGQIIIPSVNITKDLRSGQNLIEFTPTGGDIRFSCWMGMISGLIRVVDDLGTVDVQNPDTTAPPAGGHSCCAGGAAGGAPRTSIYGDITQVPTSRLVKKAGDIGKYQQANFAGKGWELEPLIVAVEANRPVRLTLDLTEFDTPEGTFQVVTAEEGDQVASFEGKKGVVTVDLTLKTAGGYAIIKDNGIIGLVEAVDDLSKADLQAIRDSYIAK